MQVLHNLRDQQPFYQIIDQVSGSNPSSPEGDTVMAASILFVSSSPAILIHNEVLSGIAFEGVYYQARQKKSYVIYPSSAS